MSTPPQPPPPNQPPPSNVWQQYQQPQGAIPVDRLKRVAIGFAILLLLFFTFWGSCHRQAPDKKKAAASDRGPLSPANIDSQEAELQREMDEAKRAAEQAEFAKRRAQKVMEDGENAPRAAQVDPAIQLRKQMQLEDIRRAHNAAYASAVAFSPASHQEEKPETVAGTPQAPAPTPATPGTIPQQPGQEPQATTSPQAQMQSADPPPGTYRLDEGTIIESVLVNRLDGEFAGPVITQVSADVYNRSGLELLIPKGSRLLGEAKDVHSFDQRRLAILFHRLILPNGKAVSLDKFRGLDQIGETGIVSKIDHHYVEIFGTSLALGAIGGLTQIGTYGGVGYDPATGLRVGVTERMGASAEQVLSKFLNKMPTIKVLEGTRIKVILTNDLTMEPYE